MDFKFTTTDKSNFDKRWSDAHFLSFLFYYYCNSQSKNNIDDPLSLTEIAKQIQWRFRDVITPSEWWTDIKPHLALENVFRFGKFLIVLFMATFTGAGHFIIHIASHTNRFVHGLSGLIRSMTPFLLGTIHILRFKGGHYVYNCFFMDICREIEQRKR